MSLCRFRVACEVTGRAWRIQEVEDGRAIVRQCGASAGFDGVFPDVSTALSAVQGWIGEDREAA
ncbi:MAG TPA: hypothetical protein DDZ88_12160 [Verrucomicrobiales bacterium]|nr:hypothetical protein [Verrucomicrobiales bacterium]